VKHAIPECNGSVSWLSQTIDWKL